MSAKRIYFNLVPFSEQKMSYVEKANFMLSASAFVMSALNHSTLSFFVAFVEAPECFISPSFF